MTVETIMIQRYGYAVSVTPIGPKDGEVVPLVFQLSGVGTRDRLLPGEAATSPKPLAPAGYRVRLRSRTWPPRDEIVMIAPGETTALELRVP